MKDITLVICATITPDTYVIVSSVHFAQHFVHWIACMGTDRMAWKLLSNACESNVVLKFCISNEVCRKRSTLKKYLNWFGHFSHTHTQFSIHSQLVHARGIIKFSESIVYRVNWCNLNKRFPISATFCMKVCSQ